MHFSCLFPVPLYIAVEERQELETKVKLTWTSHITRRVPVKGMVAKWLAR